jgi:transcriptional regulator
MLTSIVGFEIAVSSLTGKWKLGQNRAAEDRAGIAAGLAVEGTGDARSHDRPAGRPDGARPRSCSGAT